MKCVLQPRTPDRALIIKSLVFSGKMKENDGLSFILILLHLFLADIIAAIFIYRPEKWRDDSDFAWNWDPLVICLKTAQ